MLKKVVTDLQTNLKQTIYARTVHRVSNCKRTPKTELSFEPNEKKELLPKIEETSLIEVGSLFNWLLPLEYESGISELLHCMVDTLSESCRIWMTHFAFSHMNVYCKLPIIISNSPKSVYKFKKDFYTVNVKRPPDFPFMPCI